MHVINTLLAAAAHTPLLAGSQQPHRGLGLGLGLIWFYGPSRPYTQGFFEVCCFWEAACIPFGPGRSRFMADQLPPRCLENLWLMHRNPGFGPLSGPTSARGNRGLQPPFCKPLTALLCPSNWLKNAERTVFPIPLVGGAMTLVRPLSSNGTVGRQSVSGGSLSPCPPVVKSFSGKFFLLARIFSQWTLGK